MLIGALKNTEMTLWVVSAVQKSPRCCVQLSVAMMLVCALPGIDCANDASCRQELFCLCWGSGRKVAEACVVYGVLHFPLKIYVPKHPHCAKFNVYYKLALVLGITCSVCWRNFSVENSKPNIFR